MTMNSLQSVNNAFSSSSNFESTRTAFITLGIVVLIGLLLIFIGIAYHRKSSSLAFQFIAQRNVHPFFVSAFVCTLSILISVWFLDEIANNDKSQIIMVGVTIISTAVMVGLINIIGCQYYSSFFCWKCQRCIRMKARIFVFFGCILLLSIVLFNCFLCYLYFDHFEYDYHTQVDVTHIILILFTSLASLASKIAQIQWVILVLFFIGIHSSSNIFWLFGEALTCTLLSILSLFYFSPFNHLRRVFRIICISVLSIFDTTTNIAVIAVWFHSKLYWMALLQTTLIIITNVFSAYYISDYYNIPETDGTVNTLNFEVDVNEDETELHLQSISEQRNVRKICGRLSTCLGIGRIFHGILAWDHENKDMAMGREVLKLWEMIFIFFPSIALQVYYQVINNNLSLTVSISLFASFCSITLTLLPFLDKINISHQTMKKLVQPPFLEKYSSDIQSCKLEIVVEELNDVRDINVNERYLYNSMLCGSVDDERKSSAETLPSFETNSSLVAYRNRTGMSSLSTIIDNSMGMYSPSMSSAKNDSVELCEQLALHSNSSVLTSTVVDDEIYTQVDLTHPNMTAIYYHGYDEDCIKKAYNILHMKKKKKLMRININSWTVVLEMLAILNEFDIQAGRNVGRFEILWKHFICCFWCKFIHNCSFEWKKYDTLPTKKSIRMNSSISDENVFSKIESNWLMYLFLITDSYVRIYPPLMFMIVDGSIEYLLGLLVFHTMFEYISYYYILDGRFKSLKFAMKYFWIGFYSCSYSFFSAMNLEYFPCNVHFNRFMQIQMAKISVQASLLIVIIVAENIWYHSCRISQEYLLMTVLFVIAFVMNFNFISIIQNI